MSRPFKIWNADRTLRKSVVANSLQQMIQFGKSKLDIMPNLPVKVVLECDGTEVEDEEYFAFMPSDTVFQFLQGTDKWKPPQATAVSGHTSQMDYDEVDCAGGDGDGGLSPRLTHLLQKIQKDLTSVILLSADDLEIISKMSCNKLAAHLEESELFAEQVQMACSNRLENIYQTQDAMDMLRIYHASQQNSLLVEDSKKKRKSEQT